MHILTCGIFPHESKDIDFPSSQARDNGKVDVIVCLAQHLKKPRGAKPGQVCLTPMWNRPFSTAFDRTDICSISSCLYRSS